MSLARLLPAIAALALTALPALAQPFEYRRDTQFEQAVAAVNPACLPPSSVLPPQDLSQDLADWYGASGDAAMYGLRFAYQLAEECVAENFTFGNAVKYGLLTVGALIAPGVVAGYRGGELATDGMKCTAKALFDASADMDEQQKQAVKAAIDGMAAVSDQLGFLGNFRGAFAPGRLQAIRSMFELVAASYERGLELKSLEAAILATVEEGDATLRYVLNGQANRSLMEAQTALAQCRFDDAAGRLADAAPLAAEECRAYGVWYRRAERNFTAFIGRNYRQLSLLDWDNPLRGMTPQEQEYMLLRRRLEDSKTSLLRATPVFEQIEQVQRLIPLSRRSFDAIQADYEAAMQAAGEAFGGGRTCETLAALEEVAGRLAGECRSQLFQANDKQLKSPEEFLGDLVPLASRRSAAWWDRLALIEQDFNACRDGAARAGIDALRAEMSADPIVSVIDDQCQVVDQPVLAERLDRLGRQLADPQQRPPVPVPELSGLSLDEARRRLGAAGLGAGEPAEGDPAPADRDPGTVAQSEPQAGALAPACSNVALILHGPRQVLSPADDCIPADEVERVCMSRDGRHGLCRANNCSIPEVRERVCESRDGRHDLCRRNNCNPVFTNRDGGTFTVPCEWVESVTPAIPCYWEQVVPPGRRICAEGEVPASRAGGALR